MYIITTVIVSSDLCVCTVQQVTMSHQSYLYWLRRQSRLQEDKFVNVSSNIRQRREHSTCDAALNRCSTASELGSVEMELLLQNSIAIVGKANRLSSQVNVLIFHIDIYQHFGQLFFLHCVPKNVHLFIFP